MRIQVLSNGEPIAEINIEYKPDLNLSRSEFIRRIVEGQLTLQYEGGTKQDFITSVREIAVIAEKEIRNANS